MFNTLPPHALQSIFYFPSVSKNKEKLQSHECPMLIISHKKHILLSCFILSWVKEALCMRSRTNLGIPWRHTSDNNLFVKLSSQTKYLWTWHLTVVLHCSLPTVLCDTWLSPWRSSVEIKEEYSPKGMQTPAKAGIFAPCSQGSVCFPLSLCSNNNSFCNSWAGFRLLSMRRLPTV